MAEKMKPASTRRQVALNLEKCLSSKKNDDFVKITHQMLHSPVYQSLDIYSRELLRYMLDWATHSKLFWDTGTFEFSASLAVKLGLFGERKAFYCLKELKDKGFIDRYDSMWTGLPSRWGFSNRWQANSVEEVSQNSTVVDERQYRTSKKSNGKE